MTAAEFARSRKKPFALERHDVPGGCATTLSAAVSSTTFSGIGSRSSSSTLSQVPWGMLSKSSISCAGWSSCLRADRGPLGRAHHRRARARGQYPSLALPRWRVLGRRISDETSGRIHPCESCPLADLESELH